MEDKKIELDQTKINRLKIKIIGIEKENLKTKKYRQFQMEERILKVIEREVLD